MGSGSVGVLQDAWKRFAAGGESTNPSDFQVWLTVTNDILAKEGLIAHERMRTALRLSGLTPSEVRIAVQAANANLGFTKAPDSLKAIIGGRN